jgi:hypothetical protein
LLYNYAVLGPVSNASYNASDTPTLVFTELLGIFAIYLGLFGELRPRRMFTKLSRIGAGALFVVVGTYFVWRSFTELHHREAGDGTAIAAFLALASCLAAIEFVSRQKFKGWRSWPVSEASVEDVQVREVRTRHNHYFVAELAYSYVVNGEYYSGRSTRDFAKESDASDYASHARGAKTIVRYNPQHPYRSKADLPVLASL